MNKRVGRHTHLFQEENFKSHSGLDLTWKIEMDALDPEEWKCIAKMIMEVEDRPFCKAVGIPRGGTKLAEYLNEHSTGKEEDSLLIVDDVLTTGGSLDYFADQYFRNRKPKDYFGWVVFARTQPPTWVDALFRMPYIDKKLGIIKMIGMRSA